jgi:D-alanyl-D-alanine carboxypeptidase
MPEAALPDDLQRELQGVLDAVLEVSGAPALAAGVIVPGVGRWSGAAGLAEDGKPMPSDAQFAIASVTKTVVAAQVLALSDDGLLDLDAPLDDFLPDGLPAETNAATVRQALAMRSGLQDQLDMQAEADLAADPMRHWEVGETLEMLAPAPAWDADERFLYTNTNYLLLGLVIERVTDLPLAEALRAGVLADAMLARLVFQDEERPEGPLAEPFPANPDLPSGQAALEAGGGFLPSRAMATAAYAAGAMASDAATLATWGYFLYGGSVLEPDSLSAMTSFLDGDGYGLGSSEYTDIGLDGLGHDGSLPGFSSVLYADRGTGVVVAVLLNSEGYDPTIAVADLMRVVGS